MRVVPVELNHHSYPIYIGQDLLTNPNCPVLIKGTEIMVITNTTIGPLFLPKIRRNFAALQYQELILPDGEAYKTLATVNTIFDALLAAGFSRKATLIALGGGVIGDMTGFAASCYQRGINYMQIPTTLLAQVDASVGGKTAVNHALGKNMIGAFHQPKAVLCDVDTLISLPEREYFAGFAEVVKYGLIWDKALLRYLEDNVTAVQQRDPHVLIEIITRSCQIKAEIVSIDPTEQGLRAILNFGHTFAHALEQVLGYGAILHGEAVAIGLCLALDLSNRLGLIDSSLHAQTTNYLSKLNLPTKIPATCNIEDLILAMHYDKKRAGKQLQFIVLNELGKAAIRSDIELATVRNVLLVGR